MNYLKFQAEAIALYPEIILMAQEVIQNDQDYSPLFDQQYGFMGLSLVDMGKKGVCIIHLTDESDMANCEILAVVVQPTLSFPAKSDAEDGEFVAKCLQQAIMPVCVESYKASLVTIGWTNSQVAGFEGYSNELTAVEYTPR